MEKAAERRQEVVQKRHWKSNKEKRRRPDHPVVSAAFDPLAKLVSSLVASPEKSSVLDVGCGNGFLSLALEKRFGLVTGLDYSREMLSVNPCPHRYIGLSTHLPFSDKSFDIVAASHLFHHLVEFDRYLTLNEMARVARVAVVSFEPNRNNPFMFLFSLLKKEERMALKFSRGYLHELFGQIDLESFSTHVEGWIVPNKAPVWWIPVARRLAKTRFRAIGFDICAVGILNQPDKKRQSQG